MRALPASFTGSNCEASYSLGAVSKKPSGEPARAAMIA
jgi:hypothetical protein